MGTITFKTQEELAAEQLTSWRESCKVSAFQAHEALDQAGYTPEIEAMMADPATDPFTVLAWNKAGEFNRNSPTVMEMATALGLTETQLDDLFKFAQTVYA